MNEIRTQLDKKANLTTYTLNNFPLKLELMYANGGAITTFDITNSFKSYGGNLDEKKFDKYKKEITALYKDFDDIYSEINKKYGLREE